MSEGYDPLDTHGHADERADAAKKQDLAKEQHAADVRWMLNDARGRRLMRLWLEGVVRSPYRGADTETNFRCGEHNAALKLLAEVSNHAPEHLAEVMFGAGT